VTWPGSAGSPFGGYSADWSRAATIAGRVALFCTVFVVTFVLVNRFGLPVLTLVMGGAVAVVLLSYLSLRNIAVVLVIWLLSMSGFRTLGMVRMPGLPDFSFDRILLVWIVMVFVLRMAGGRDVIKRPYLPDVLIILHTIYILVQLHILSDAVHTHQWVLSNLAPLFGYLFGKYVLNKPEHLRTLLVFLLLLAVYYYVESIAQRYLIYPLIWPKAILDPNAGLHQPGRSGGPVLHPPLFGQMLGMFLLVHFYFLARPLRSWVKILLGFSLAGSAVGLLFTFTRAPWVATAVGLMMLAVLRPAYRRLAGIFVVLALLAGMFGALRLADTEFLQERLENTNTLENRFGVMANVLQIARDHPLFGVGYFRVTDYLDQYNQGVYVPLYGYVKKGRGANIPIHDIYIGRLAEEGLFSGFLLLGFFIVIAKAWWGRWRTGPFDDWCNRDLLAFLAAVMVAYMIGGLMIDYRYFDLINVIFFLFAGIIVGYDAEPTRPSATVASEPPVPVYLPT